MIPLNNNVEREEIQNLLNQIGELYTLIGNEVILYPLKIVSGIVNLTETGEQPLNYDTKDFTTNVGIITSNAPIVCYWEGAFKSKKTRTIPGLFQDKIFSAENGRKIKTWICSYSVEQVVGSAELNNNSYTTIMLNRNIRSFSRDWNPDDNEMRNYLYLYLDKKAQSPQFLRLTRKEPRFIPSNNKFVGCDLEFTNLNVEYSQSGKDIFNFVKMTNPGGNYAFPKEIETPEGVEITLDPDKLNNRGVKDIQLEFNAPYALNSINVIGRTKDNQKIFAPRKLLLVNPHPPITSVLSVDGSSLNNYYAVFEAEPKYQSFWGNWHEKYEASYNVGAKKTYNGGVTIDFNETKATNPIITGTNEYSKNLWLNWTFSPASEHTYEVPEVPFCVDTLHFENNVNYTPSDFLNINGFINYATETLPLEWGEHTRGTIGDYGMLGKAVAGFLSIFTFGYSIGWITNNTWIPSKKINFLIPATTFYIGRTISGDAENQPIGFDIFDNNTDFTASGNNSMMCGYRFELTRYFQDSTQVIAGQPEGKGGNGIWDTMYLGQTHYESGEWIKASHEPVLWTDNSKAITPLNPTEEYEVDMVCYQGIGKGDCRMSFNSYPYNDASVAISVYETRQQTNAKFKNDMHLWRNFYRLNYSEEMNNEGYVDYPAGVLPPAPQQYIKRIYDFDGLYNIGYYNAGEKALSLDYRHEPEQLINHEGLCWDKVYGAGQLQYRIKDSEKGKVINGVTQQGAFLVDLTRTIGIDKLSDYVSFVFTVAITGYDGHRVEKNMEVLINDLPDNQWKPIKIADISEVIGYAGGDAYPNNMFRWKHPRDFGEETHDIRGEFFTGNVGGDEFKYYKYKTTDCWMWFKLNKSTQQLAIGFDNPENVVTSEAPISMYRNYKVYYDNKKPSSVEFWRGKFFEGYDLQNFAIKPATT